MATELAKAYVQIVPSAEGMKGMITKEIGGEADSAGKSAGISIAGAVKKADVAAGIGTALKAAITEGAARNSPSVVSKRYLKTLRIK